MVDTWNTDNKVNNNQVSPGHPSGGYNAGLNDPYQNSGTGQINNNQGNVDTSAWQQAAETMSQAGIGSIGGHLLQGDMGYGNNENQFQINQQAEATQEAANKMLAFQKAQANYDKYGDDLSKWLQDPDAYEHAYDIGFFENQAEGMLGGVTQYEKDVNLMKKAIESKIGKMYTQDLTNAQFESGLAGLPEYQQLLKLFGGNEEAMQNTLFSPGTFDPNVDTGYDPTGTNTWQDTESDPEKLEAYRLLTGGDPNDNPYSDEYMDALNKILYGFPSFDENWYGSDWDSFLGAPWKQETASMTDPKWWQQTALSDITPTGFSDFQHMYGKEFGEERVASPHSWGIEPFSEMIIEGDY